MLQLFEFYLGQVHVHLFVLRNLFTFGSINGVIKYVYVIYIAYTRIVTLKMYEIIITFHRTINDE